MCAVTSGYSGALAIETGWLCLVHRDETREERADPAREQAMMASLPELDGEHCEGFAAEKGALRVSAPANGGASLGRVSRISPCAY